MKAKPHPIAANMSVAEASVFWDKHSVADFPSRVVRMEYRPDKSVSFVALADGLMSALQKRARKQGVSPETLLNLWLQEKLSA
jgi:hypothetical protein